MHKEISIAVDYIGEALSKCCNRGIVNAFKECLTEVLVERFTDHWYEDEPYRGCGYRTVTGPTFQYGHAEMDCPVLRTVRDRLGFDEHMLTKCLKSFNDEIVHINPGTVRVTKHRKKVILYQAQVEVESLRDSSQDLSSDREREEHSSGAETPWERYTESNSGTFSRSQRRGASNRRNAEDHLAGRRNTAVPRELLDLKGRGVPFSRARVPEIDFTCTRRMRQLKALKQTDERTRNVKEVESRGSDTSWSRAPRCTSAPVNGRAFRMREFKTHKFKTNRRRSLACYLPPKSTNTPNRNRSSNDLSSYLPTSSSSNLDTWSSNPSSNTESESEDGHGRSSLRNLSKWQTAIRKTSPVLTSSVGNWESAMGNLNLHG